MEIRLVQAFGLAAARANLLELQRLKDQPVRGSYEKFLGVMAKVPAADRPDCDRLSW